MLNHRLFIGEWNNPTQRWNGNFPKMLTWFINIYSCESAHLIRPAVFNSRRLSSRSREENEAQITGVMFSGGGLGRSNWSSHLGDLSYTLHAWRPGFVRLAVISTPASVRSHESPSATGPPEPVVFYNKSSAQTLRKWSLISPDPDYESLRHFRDHKLQIKLIYVACEQNWLVSDADWVVT